MIKNLTGEVLLQAIQKEGRTALVVFYLSTCPYCEDLLPRLGEIAKKSAIELYLMDAKKYEDVFHQYNLRWVPQTLIFDQGRLKQVLEGDLPDEIYWEHIGQLKTV